MQSPKKVVKIVEVNSNNILKFYYDSWHMHETWPWGDLLKASCREVNTGFQVVLKN